MNVSFKALSTFSARIPVFQSTDFFVSTFRDSLYYTASKVEDDMQQLNFLSSIRTRLILAINKYKA